MQTLILRQFRICAVEILGPPGSVVVPIAEARQFNCAVAIDGAYDRACRFKVCPVVKGKSVPPCVILNRKSNGPIVEVHICREGAVSP